MKKIRILTIKLKEGTRYAFKSSSLATEGVRWTGKIYMHLTERTIQYHAPFFKSDREEGCRVAWDVFEERKQ